MLLLTDPLFDSSGRNPANVEDNACRIAATFGDGGVPGSRKRAWAACYQNGDTMLWSKILPTATSIDRTRGLTSGL